MRRSTAKADRLRKAPLATGVAAPASRNDHSPPSNRQAIQ